MTRSADLGKAHVARLRQGDVRYFERGSGRPIVFVHGVLTNANLWRSVVPDVAAAGFRCLAPDLPLGAHETPMHADADLSPVGNADLLADFLDALDLRDVILVANDTGGALTQILLSRRPARVDRVVLLPSDCFEYFFPPIFKALPYVARIPGATRVLSSLLRALHPMPFVFGWVAKRPLPKEIVESYLWPPGESAGVRRDLRKLLREVHPRHTLAAAEALRTFTRPVLLLWGKEEKLFPVRLAYRLADVLPDARVVEVADTYTFIAEDRPAEVVRHVIEFANVMAD